MTSLIHLELLGPNEKAAIRTILTELHRRGWRDIDGLAVAVVARLREDGRAPDQLAQLATRAFLAVNRITRRDLSQAFAELFDV